MPATLKHGCRLLSTGRAIQPTARSRNGWRNRRIPLGFRPKTLLPVCQRVTPDPAEGPQGSKGAVPKGLPCRRSAVAGAAPKGLPSLAPQSHSSVSSPPPTGIRPSLTLDNPQPSAENPQSVTTWCVLLGTGSRLPAPGYRLPATGYWLQFAGAENDLRAKCRP